MLLCNGSEKIILTLHVSFLDNMSIDEEYKLSSLLLVYIAVSLPLLTLDPNSFYSRERGGAYLFIHILLLQSAWQQLVSREPVTKYYWPFPQRLPAADSVQNRYPEIRGLLVCHTFQSDWRSLQQSMSADEKHISVRRLLFRDILDWRTSIVSLGMWPHL